MFMQKKDVCFNDTSQARVFSFLPTDAPCLSQIFRLQYAYTISVRSQV